MPMPTGGQHCQTEAKDGLLCGLLLLQK